MRTVPSTTPSQPPARLPLPYTFSYNILSPRQILLIELSNNLKYENGGTPTSSTCHPKIVLASWDIWDAMLSKIYSLYNSEGNCKIQCHQFHSGWLINPWRYARQTEPQVSLSWLTNVSPELIFSSAGVATPTIHKWKFSQKSLEWPWQTQLPTRSKVLPLAWRVLPVAYSCVSSRFCV